MAQRQPARRKAQSSSAPVLIPDKLYFRIGDVAKLCNLPAYVLRFWETEFPQLKPNKGGTGQRLYRKRDVEVVLEIKRLLYDEGFTIAGARRLLAEKRRTGAEAASAPHPVARPVEVMERPSSLKAAKAALPKPASNAGKNPEKPDIPKPEIKELRKEMRELLALLGSDPAERKSEAQPARRETKKSRRLDEPTLF